MARKENLADRSVAVVCMFGIYLFNRFHRNTSNCFRFHCSRFITIVLPRASQPASQTDSQSVSQSVSQPASVSGAGFDLLITAEQLPRERSLLNVLEVLRMKLWGFAVSSVEESWFARHNHITYAGACQQASERPAQYVFAADIYSTNVRKHGHR